MSGLQAGFVQSELSRILKVTGYFPVNHFKRNKQVNLLLFNSCDDMAGIGEQMTAKSGFMDDGIAIADQTELIRCV